MLQSEYRPPSDHKVLIVPYSYISKHLVLHIYEVLLVLGGDAINEMTMGRMYHSHIADGRHCKALLADYPVHTFCALNVEQGGGLITNPKKYRFFSMNMYLILKKDCNFLMPVIYTSFTLFCQHGSGGYFPPALSLCSNCCSTFSLMASTLVSTAFLPSALTTRVIIQHMSTSSS